MSSGALPPSAPLSTSAAESAFGRLSTSSQSQCSTDPGLIAGTWHRPLFLMRDRWFESGSLQGRVCEPSVPESPRLRSPAAGAGRTVRHEALRFCHRSPLRPLWRREGLSSWSEPYAYTAIENYVGAGRTMLRLQCD